MYECVDAVNESNLAILSATISQSADSRYYTFCHYRADNLSVILIQKQTTIQKKNVKPVEKELLKIAAGQNLFIKMQSGKRC